MPITRDWQRRLDAADAQKPAGLCLHCDTVFATVAQRAEATAHGCCANPRIAIAAAAAEPPPKIAAYVAGDVCGSCSHDECIGVVYVWERRLGLLRDRRCPTHGRPLRVAKPSELRRPRFVRLTEEVTP